MSSRQPCQVKAVDDVVHSQHLTETVPHSIAASIVGTTIGQSTKKDTQRRQYSQRIGLIVSFHNIASSKNLRKFERCWLLGDRHHRSITECRAHDHRSYDRISKFSDVPYKRMFAWVLMDPQRFETPFAYMHRQGAVIWVQV